MSPTTTSSQRLMSNTLRSPRASSGSLMTSTTMTSPSARRSLTRAEDEPITLKKKACRPVCRRQSVMIERGDPLVANFFRAPKELRDTTLKVNRLGLSWSDKQSRFSLTVKRRLKNTNSRLIMTVQTLSETIESQQEELHCAQAEERRRRDHQLLHEKLLKQNWDLREAHEKSLSEMEELKRFQGSTFDTIARRKLVEDRGTILELTGKIQELQYEINCMSDSRERFSRCRRQPDGRHTAARRQPARRQMAARWPPDGRKTAGRRPGARQQNRSYTVARHENSSQTARQQPDRKTSAARQQPDSSWTAARNTMKESNQNTQKQRTVSQTWVEKMEKNGRLKKWKKRPENVKTTPHKTIYAV